MIVLATSGVACLPDPSVAAASDATDAEGLAILAKYAASAEERDVVAAVGHLLDYSILTEGENAPRTAQLTHRYGVLLMRAGEYREAIKVLNTALDRSNAVFGEFAGEAFEINMNIGYAYGHLGRRRIYAIDNFERALEVLRQRGERESVRYVSALLNVVGSIADNDGLRGSTSTTVPNHVSLPGNDWLLSLEHAYRNAFGKAEAYLDEAEELADKLTDQDKYLPAKVAIARAKLGVLETTDLARVEPGVRGRITEQTIGERNGREEERLDAAMTVLSEDAEANAVFLAAAHSTLLDIAWLDNDQGRMRALCASGVLDSSAAYPADRLFRVAADGSVLAPKFSFYVPSNLFENRIRRYKAPTDANGKRLLQPYYVPVCSNGELMAALVNAPRVIIEEYR